MTSFIELGTRRSFYFQASSGDLTPVLCGSCDPTALQGFTSVSISLLLFPVSVLRGMLLVEHEAAKVKTRE